MSCLICDETELDGREAVCRACVERYGRQAQARKRDRAPRNEHDTRVATVITCSECGKEDRIPFVPRRREKVMCRDCAATILDIHLPGAEAPPSEGGGPDLYEQLGVEKNIKRRTKDLKIDSGSKPGSVVFKRKKRRD
jgi:CxxC-x17-CxxC domain-containing protein